ncbi:hypothetical protein GpartN1_g996.t1 [Galdieria partita]|uniref:Uncharacterized protein n=1 Tax=Galdieria partita TaxID=83374 RepID=A0A9C7UN72_9RHOD|nr:hypothetical protein GpartN1_g996.t1 [Galdieria partita]
MASLTKDSFSEDVNREKTNRETSASSGALAPQVTSKVTVTSSVAEGNHQQTPSQQKVQPMDVSKFGLDFYSEKVSGVGESDKNIQDNKAPIYLSSTTATAVRLDSSLVHKNEVSGDLSLYKSESTVPTVFSKAGGAVEGNLNKTEVPNIQNEPGDEKNVDKGPFLTKEQFDDLVRRCSFLAIYSSAKVPKVRYKRLEESVLTICRLFYTRRHKIDWFVEELNRSEGHDWTVSQWVAFLHGSNFKMVKLKAYKGIGNFCYYNGSVFTTAGILGSCKCLREVRTGFGGKQGNRDVLPDEELKALYESEEIVKVDPNAFPDDSEIAPLKPVRPRMTLKRQSDSIAQTYGLENSSLKNPKISYSLTMGEVAFESLSKAGSSPMETDSDVEIAELEASQQENDMESTESSESGTKNSIEKDSPKRASRKRVVEDSMSRSQKTLDTNSTQDSRIHNNERLSLSDTVYRKDTKSKMDDRNQQTSDEYIDSILIKFSVQMQEKLDRAIQELEIKMDLITQRVSKLEERFERQIS